MLPDALIFEVRDTEIFVIPDTKTKLNTLQNYFFPRLQKLIDLSVLQVRDVYQIDPFEKYSFIYSPSHRKEAKTNRDTNQVLIGLSGRRDPTRQLKIKRPDGKPYAFHPASAAFEVTNTGQMSVYVWPFSHDDETYFWKVKKYLARHYDEFTALLNVGGLSYITHADQTQVVTLKKMLSDRYYFQIRSPILYLPIENPAAIDQLILSFVLLFPLLDTCHALAEGVEPSFPEHIKSLSKWFETRDHPKPMRLDVQEIQPPDLDSYTFVRAGLWYQVLARDNWTCCSCHRSTREHSIVLHVDHIVPRSRGGKDDITNLQTLCMKCNLGKSNRDSTDLRGQI
jgi:hypothetical protein